MHIQGRTFALNKADKKVLGVCSGLADLTGVDAVVIRVVLVVATIAGAFPWTVLAYLAAALLARPAGSRRLVDAAAEQERLRSQDLRMQAIETYVAGSNSRLAREIEELR